MALNYSKTLLDELKLVEERYESMLNDSISYIGSAEGIRGIPPLDPSRATFTTIKRSKYQPEVDWNSIDYNEIINGSITTDKISMANWANGTNGTNGTSTTSPYLIKDKLSKYSPYSNTFDTFSHPTTDSSIENWEVQPASDGAVVLVNKYTGQKVVVHTGSLPIAPAPTLQPVDKKPQPPEPSQLELF